MQDKRRDQFSLSRKELQAAYAKGARARKKARKKGIVSRVLAELRDWRTKRQKAADRKLEGTWWRCRTHGLSQKPIHLGALPYCPADDCDRHMILVHSAGYRNRRPELDADGNRKLWNAPREDFR